MDGYNDFVNTAIYGTFVLIVLATLPNRTASQGESFTFIASSFPIKYTFLASFFNAHLGGFFFLKPFHL